jgi:hypothetical protein
MSVKQEKLRRLSLCNNDYRKKIQLIAIRQGGPQLYSEAESRGISCVLSLQKEVRRVRNFVLINVGVAYAALLIVVIIHTIFSWKSDSKVDRK